MSIGGSVTAMGQSRIWRFIAALGGAAVIASVGISGCHDQPLPLAPDPTPVAAPEPSLSRYPTEEEYAEMPGEFRAQPGITDRWVDAGFVSGKAYAQAAMTYLANYATTTVTATLLYNNSEVTKSTGFEERSYYLPLTRQLSAATSVAVNGSCGYTVNGNARFYVHNQFPLSKTGWFVWGRDSRTADQSASQPACSCGSTAPLQDAGYDPYASDGDSYDCGTNGTSGGSGIQFHPGDNTGGETVDWNTGIGNGGSSVCGGSAVVEYVCIDVWNVETDSWQKWACGYATTC